MGTAAAGDAIMTAPYRNLKVWQLAHELALQVYRATASYSVSERYGLVSQMRRAAVAVATNIVEGNARSHKGEYLQFCNVARASVAEMKYLLELSLDLELLPVETYNRLHNGYDHLGALLYSFIKGTRAMSS